MHLPGFPLFQVITHQGYGLASARDFRLAGARDFGLAHACMLLLFVAGTVLWASLRGSRPRM